jgi:hypothetical protein
MLLTISTHVILSHFWSTELLTNHIINKHLHRNKVQSDLENSTGSRSV